MTDTATNALQQIKERIGDLQKLKDQAHGEGRKWALDAVWNIAHNTLIEIDRASPKPFVSACCEGERCPCGEAAEHKVEETIFHDDPLPNRHPLTSYICHHHFAEIMGPAADRSR